MSPKIIDNYQEKRADRRDKRGVKKGEGTLDASGNYVPTDVCNMKATVWCYGVDVLIFFL